MLRRFQKTVITIIGVVTLLLGSSLPAFATATKATNNVQGICVQQHLTPEQSANPATILSIEKAQMDKVLKQENFVAIRL